MTSFKTSLYSWYWMYWQGGRREVSWAGAGGAVGWAGTGQEQQGHATPLPLSHRSPHQLSAPGPSQRWHSEAQRSRPLTGSSCSCMRSHVPMCCSVSCPGPHLLRSLRTPGSTLIHPGGTQPQPETQTIRRGSKPPQMGKETQEEDRKMIWEPMSQLSVFGSI